MKHLRVLSPVRDFGLKRLGVLAKRVLDRRFADLHVRGVVGALQATTPVVAEKPRSKALAIHLQALALLALASLDPCHD